MPMNAMTEAKATAHTDLGCLDFEVAVLSGPTAAGKAGREIGVRVVTDLSSTTNVVDSQLLSVELRGSGFRPRRP